ncbi:hypothetical protein GCM10025792_26750 [Pseudonocardia tropica]
MATLASHGLRTAPAPDGRVVAACTVAAVVLAVGGAGCVLLAVNVAAGAPSSSGRGGFWPMQVVGLVTYGVVGGLLVARRTAGVLGPVFLVVALSQAASLFGREYGVYGLQVVDGLPADRWLFWSHTWSWVPGLLALLVVVPLLLPDGTLPSQRWRPVVLFGVCAIAVATTRWATTPYELLDGPATDAAIGPNPLALSPGPSALVGGVAAPLVALGVVLAAAGLVARWRRAGPDGRRALSWMLYGVAVTVACEVVAMATASVLAAALAVGALPVCCMIAVSRHRLWDLQLVVGRSLVYGGLSVAVAVAYAGVVGLLGGAIGVGTGAPIVGTAVVAMLVLPLHHVLRRVVNRLVHGSPEDPHRVITRLAMRLGAAVPADQVASSVLPDILTEVSRTLGLRHLSLETADGRIFPDGSPPDGPVQELALRHAGRRVGVLRAVPVRGGLTRSERRALTDVAAQAAVAVHALALSDELRRERERAAAAREEERDRLRRRLHDGVGTALAAASLQADSVRDLIDESPDEGRAVLHRLGAQLRDAVRDVRAITRDLRPALLDELGPEGALRELGARSSTPACAVEVELGELGPLPAEVELAAHLLVAELVTNACRHADATRVRVYAHRREGFLLVRVSDNGRGTRAAAGASPGLGLHSLRRRVDGLGGTLEVWEGPGTIVEAALPVPLR